MFEILPNWHPIFVHFTVALLTMTAVCHVLALLMRTPSPLRDEIMIVARWMLWLGAAFAIITALFGLLAFTSVKHDTISHAAMTIHRNWAIATLLIFTPLAVWSLQRYRAGLTVTPLFIVLLLIGSGVLAITAWRGGEVVYRYGIGVMALPKLDRHEHNAGDMRENPTTMMSDPTTAPAHIENERSPGTQEHVH